MTKIWQDKYKLLVPEEKKHKNFFQNMMWKLDSTSCKLRSPKVILPQGASKFSQFKPKIILEGFNSRYRYQYSTISNLWHYVVDPRFFINELRKTFIDEKQFSFTDLSWEINFALFEFSNCWRHLLPKKARHVPSIIHTNWVLLAKKLYCARAVHRWVTPGILSNDSGKVIEIKVVSIQLRLKFNQLKPRRTRKALKISLSVNVNGHSETTFSSLFVGGLCYWQWPLIDEKNKTICVFYPE